MNNFIDCEPHLTAREFECLNALADGLKVDEIGRRFNISIATVTMHLTNARRKLNAKSREHAVAIALRSGVMK